MSVDENYSEKKPMTTQDILRLSAEELHHRLAQGETVTVLDVRTEDALSVQPEKIPGSRWLPLPDVVEHAPTLPRQGLVITYCT
jgi:rhodanese-related sulfurtransferase